MRNFNSWMKGAFAASLLLSAGAVASAADSSIEGEWTIKLNGHYIGDYSLGEFDGPFIATLEDETVTFESTDSQYNIVATFTDDTTLSFEMAAVSNTASTYRLTQSPFINTDNSVDDIEDLTEQSFTATYDAANGTITFPEYSGLRYGYFDAEGNLSYWDDAFDFVSAQKVGVGAEGAITVDGTMTAQLDMSQGFGEPDLDEAETFEVKATYDPEAKTLTFESLADSPEPIVFNIDIENGTVKAEGKQLSYHEEFEDDGELISLDYYYGDYLTMEYGVNGTIKNINNDSLEITLDPWGDGMDYLPDYMPIFFNTLYYNTVITLPFQINGLPSDVVSTSPAISFTSAEASYGMNQVWLAAAYETENMPEEYSVYVVVIEEEAGIQIEEKVDDSPFSILIEANPNDEEMTRSYKVQLLVKDEYEDTIAESEVKTIDFTTTGINGIMLDNDANAVYFNLQGQKVANPANGLYIRVEGGKAVKVIK